MQHSSLRTAVVPSATILLVALAGACGQGGGDAGDPAVDPPFQPVASLHDLMHDVVYPNAEVVWKSVGTIISYAGTEEIRPADEEAWEKVLQSALTLAEAGNLLMIRGRADAQEDGLWVAKAQGLTEATIPAVEAARNRDAEAIFDLGEGIYNACNGCHEEYWESPPSAMRP